MFLKKRKRCYFYYLNERGHLFHIFDVKGLLNVQHKKIPSGPTFLTDPKFLNFFYNRIEYNHLQHIRESDCFQSLENNKIENNNNNEICILEDGTPLSPLSFLLCFPYVSTCGGELNYIHTQDGVPAVFHHLLNKNNNNKNENNGNNEMVLSMEGTMLEEGFDPHKVKVSSEGKLFHELTCLKKIKSQFSEFCESEKEENKNTNIINEIHHHPERISSLFLARHPPLLEQLFKNENQNHNIHYYHHFLSHIPTLTSPYALLGASIGLELGFDYLSEERSNDGCYVMEWEGRPIKLPFL